MSQHLVIEDTEMTSSTSLPEDRRKRRRNPGSYYGNGLPYLPIDGYPGKIIAIEGTDGVGRSTQIALLREWLEVQGYGVIETGWTRSELMQPTIELAKSSNTLNKLTFVLLYATDFADRLEKEIIPALKAGFIVLSDRYIYTAMARAGVRGVDSVDPEPLRVRDRAAPGLLPEDRRRHADPPRAAGARHGLLGVGHGHEARRRHLRQLPRLSAALLKEYARWPTSSASACSTPAEVDVIQDELRRQIGAFLAEANGPTIAGRRPAAIERGWNRVTGLAGLDRYTEFTSRNCRKRCDTICGIACPVRRPSTLTVRPGPRSRRPPRSASTSPELLLRRRSGRCTTSPSASTANLVTAFIGPSGCGKSTFLRTLNRMNDIIPGTRVEGRC